MTTAVSPLFLINCAPRWATRRQPDRATRGEEVARIAEILGTPLMPWQRLVADVALEVDSTTGRFAYSEVRLTVPRQSGKTTLLLAVMIHRALLMGDPQTIVYAAQSGVAARQKFIDDYMRVIQRSALGSAMRPRLTSGHEAMFWDTGSRMTIAANTEKSGHGQVVDLAVIDEAFAQPDARLEQAFRPAMNTRPQPQLWIVSTAGTPESSQYLRGKIDDGRQRAEDGATDTVAFFEWSAPDGIAPDEESAWWECMPALGHTTPIEAVRAALASGMESDEFRRAYLNQWCAKDADDLALPLSAWAALADPASQIEGAVAFGVDVTPDRSFGAIAAFGARDDGFGHIELIDYRPDAAWIVERLADLRNQWGPCAVVIDPQSAAGALLPDLEAAGIPVQLMTARSVAQSAGSLYDSVLGATVRHLNQPQLTAAVAGARRRQLGDSWAFGRRSSSVDICPLVAASFARWGFVSAEARHVDVTANIW